MGVTGFQACHRFDGTVPDHPGWRLPLTGSRTVDQHRTVLAQLLDHLPRHRLRRIAARYGGDHGIRRFTTWDHFVTMAFAQLTRRESLRDIEACLGAVSDKLS